MASELLLPLFPLEVVLLPGNPLPLHIFEERYRLLIGECLEQKAEFGVVLCKDDALARSGCSATVERVVERYPDGRLDIVTVGRRRFEILFTDEQRPYLRGAVHFFEDDPGTGAAQPASQRLAGLVEEILRLLPGPSRTGVGAGENAFQVAAAVPLQLGFRQRLLESRSEAERVAWLCEYLEKLAPRLQLARRVERVARSNGSGRK